MSLRPILVEVSDLWQDTNYSPLKVTATVGSNTIQVYSILDFAVNKYLLIGEFGQEGSEIIKTHASTAPTGNTVTLASNLAKAHAKDTPVYIIPYDQIEISHATTIAGAKSVLSTQAINPEHSEIRYDDTTAADGFYFTRYKETIGGTFSSYSDPIPSTGHEQNTVGFVIYNAMEELGKEFSSTLTYGMLINKINACLRFIRGKLKHWSNYQQFNHSLGDTVLGTNSILLPTTYYDKNSNKSCQSLKVDGISLTYIDKKEYDTLIKNEYSGSPIYFTIYDGYIYIPGVAAEDVGKAITIDFYTDIDVVDSDTDIISGARYDMVEYWLKWEIRNITENNGKRDMTDGDYIMFQTILSDTVRRESNGQKWKQSPKINGISYGNEDSLEFERS